MRATRALAAAATAGVLVLSMVVGSAASAASTSKSPITIAYLGILTGPNASPTAENPLKLAADEINARGGADGHPVKLEFYDANITPQQAVTATQKALATNPTAIIGPLVDDQVQATAQLLKQSGVPTLGLTSGPLTDYTNTHLNNFFDINPIDYNTAQAEAKYVYTKYKPKTVGLIYTQDAASTASANFIEEFLKKDGVKNFIVRSEADGVTDATTAVLAMKPADAVFVNSFPVTDGLLVTELAQNGITVPIMGAQGDNAVQAFKLAPASAMANMYYPPYCDPDVNTTTQAKAFTSAYKAAYPSTSQTAVDDPATYDGVSLIAKAIQAAGGSTSHSAIVTQLEKLQYQGACGPYKNDSEHVMINQAQIVKLGSNGPSGKELMATYNFGSIPASAH
ncbi:MAG: ABC transporter substrate-binding protein [Acidimicrobiales bacterium]